MSDKIPPVGRDRPFPWRCSECKAKEVYPKATDYTTAVKHDGRSYSIHIPDLAIATCRNCNAQTFSVRDDDRIFATLRAQIGLLTPEEMQKRRNQLELSQHALAEQLGVAKETISRWETGAMIQSRAMDNLLRLYFDSAEVRMMLERGFTPAPVDRIQRTKVAIAKLDQAFEGVRGIGVAETADDRMRARMSAAGAVYGRATPEGVSGGASGGGCAESERGALERRLLLPVGPRFWYRPVVTATAEA